VFDNNLFLHFLYLDEVKIEQDENIFSGKFYLDDSEKNVAIIIKITQEKKFILDIEINYDWLFSTQGLAWVATMGLRIAMGHYIQWSGNVTEDIGRQLLAIGVNLMFSQLGVPIDSFMQELKDAGVTDLEDVMESLSL
jgi:hypothetical protein